MRPNYPFNCWYVAATSDEVGPELLARRLLDKPVLLYRRGSGEIVAMEDRCVHRRLPLSLGRVRGDGRKGNPGVRTLARDIPARPGR